MSLVRIVSTIIFKQNKLYNIFSLNIILDSQLGHAFEQLRRLLPPKYIPYKDVKENYLDIMITIKFEIIFDATNKRISVMQNVFGTLVFLYHKGNSCVIERISC